MAGGAGGAAAGLRGLALAPALLSAAVLGVAPGRGDSAARTVLVRPLLPPSPPWP